MGTRAGTLSLCVALAAVALAPACSHITKLPVAEVPIDQFQATPVAAAPEAPVAVPTIVQPEAPPPPTVSAATSPATAASSKSPATPAKPLETLETPEEKVQAAAQALKSGKRADLLAARKNLLADVGTPNGTVSEARMLRSVCARLLDKACVTKASAYIK